MEEKILEILSNNSVNVDDGYGGSFCVVMADDTDPAKEISSLFSAFITWIGKCEFYTMYTDKWYKVNTNDPAYTLEEVFQYWLDNIYNK